MHKFLKDNKIILGVVAGLILLVLLVHDLGGGHSNKGGNVPPSSQSTINNPAIVDNATSDNTAESLNALTQELHAVIASNAKLKASNAALAAKNSKIIHSINEEVQKTLQSELQKRGEDNQAKLTQMQQSLTALKAKIAASTHHKTNNQYTVGGYSNELAGATHIHIAGQTLIAVPSLQPMTTVSQSGVHTVPPIQNGNQNVLPSNSSAFNGQKRQKLKPIPYFTIPSGATLGGSVTMSALIGRIPINGVVKSPYPFKIILGKDNMAANGLYVPGVSGAIIQGVAVGDLELRAVRGYITAITFVFPDGTISTTSMQGSGGDIGSYSNNSLGYISAPNGNPFPGVLKTNAPKFLATMTALGALNKGGQAYAMAQETNQTNAFGGTTSSLTGSVGKYMAGSAAQGGTEQVMNWYLAREKNSFDAIYVPQGQKAVINITKQININYNPHGRKIYYAHSHTHRSNRSLD